MTNKNICNGFEKKCNNKQVREGLCRNCLGEKFRSQIIEILRDIWGVLPEKEIYIKGSKCDIFIENNIHEKIRVRYYIECKDIKNGVGVNKINEFIFNLIALKFANEIDLGIYVSRFGFSPNAKDRTKAYNINTFTLEELNYIQNNKNKEKWSSEIKHKIELNKSIPKPAILSHGDENE